MESAFAVRWRTCPATPECRGTCGEVAFSSFSPGCIRAATWRRSESIAQKLELNLRVRVAFMSTGMRQKLALSVVMGVDTPLLILDEPTANLDPTVRAAVLDLVRDARDEGRTVVFSSHVLSEIEETCDRVAFLRRGRLVHQLALSDLYQRHRITATDPGDPIDVPHELSDRVQVTASTTKSNGRIRIDTAGDLAPLLSWIDSLRLTRVRIEPLGLRAVYDSVHHGETIPATDNSGWAP